MPSISRLTAVGGKRVAQGDRSIGAVAREMLHKRPYASNCTQLSDESAQIHTCHQLHSALSISASRIFDCRTSYLFRAFRMSTSTSRALRLLCI